MKSFSLRAFEFTLVLFALSVALTMHAMATGGEEQQLWGFNYSYYLIPLLTVNIMICLGSINVLRMSGLNKWILLWTIVVTLSSLFISSNPIIALIRVNIWTTSYFAAYCLVRNNRNSIDDIVKVFIIIFFISLFFFWHGKMQQSVNYKYGFETRSNAIYCLVTIVPFIMLLKKKWFVLFLILLIFVSTVFSTKRGATLILIFTLIPVIRSVFAEMRSKTWRSVLIMLIVGATAYMLFYISESFLGGVIIDRFTEAKETGGGRTGIWVGVLNAYNNNSSIPEQLFGHGFYSVSSLGSVTAAHNDFIEVLYDYGIVGIIIYLIIHFYMIFKLLRLKKQKNTLFFSYAVMYMIFFIMSMVSILIVQQRYLVYMAIFWGMLEGCNYKYEITSNEMK